MCHYHSPILKLARYMAYSPGTVRLKQNSLYSGSVCNQYTGSSRRRTNNASRQPLGHRVAGSHQQTKPKKAQTARVSMMMHVLFSPPEKHFLRGFPYFDTRNIRYTGNSILNTKLLLLRAHKVPVLSPTTSSTVLISYFISSPSYKKLRAAVA